MTTWLLCSVVSSGKSTFSSGQSTSSSGKLASGETTIGWNDRKQFDVTSIGQRLSSWMCNSVKVEMKIHLIIKTWPKVHMVSLHCGQIAYWLCDRIHTSSSCDCFLSVPCTEMFSSSFFTCFCWGIMHDLSLVNWQGKIASERNLYSESDTDCINHHQVIASVDPEKKKHSKYYIFIRKRRNSWQLINWILYLPACEAMNNAMNFHTKYQCTQSTNNPHLLHEIFFDHDSQDGDDEHVFYFWALSLSTLQIE